jgi:hypothetical protein
MSFDSWLLGIMALLLTGGVIHALWAGRTTVSRRIERASEPDVYWLATGFFIIVAMLFGWTWLRSVQGDESAGFHAGLYLGPHFLYLILETLRAGEFRWGNNRFPRRGRAQVYWTILLLCLIGFAFFTGSLIYDQLGTAV